MLQQSQEGTRPHETSRGFHSISLTPLARGRCSHRTCRTRDTCSSFRLAWRSTDGLSRGMEEVEGVEDQLTGFHLVADMRHRAWDTEARTGSGGTHIWSELIKKVWEADPLRCPKRSREIVVFRSSTRRMSSSESCAISGFRKREVRVHCATDRRAKRPSIRGPTTSFCDDDTEPVVGVPRQLKRPITPLAPLVQRPQPPAGAVFDFRAHFCHSASMEAHALGFRLRATALSYQLARACR
jgi:hypothetical protein